MKYQDCLEHLEQLGNEVVTMRLGVGSIRTLLQEMGNPHLDYPSVLVAGTNGKGSIARFISSIAGSCGLLTGRFSSPHLVTVRERICLNETALGREAFAESFARVQKAARTANLPHPPTYFETLCATALDYFSCQSIDLAVLEIGLGGRLDSTNAVDPVLSVLGPIGLDHQLFLGNTIAGDCIGKGRDHSSLHSSRVGSPAGRRREGHQRDRPEEQGSSLHDRAPSSPDSSH